MTKDTDEERTSGQTADGAEISDNKSGSSAQQGAKPRIWLQRAALIASIAVGLLFLVAGALKVYDPYSFYSQIRGYRIVGHGLSKIAAILLPPLELGIGILAIFGPRRRLAAGLLVGFLLVFMGATAHAWLYGTTDNCGCFGEFVSRSPKATFFEDAFMLAAALLGALVSQPQRPPGRFKTWMRWALAGLAVVASAGLSLANGALGISPGGKLKVGLAVENWHLRELNVPGYKKKGIHPNLSRGTSVVVFFSPLCRHCWAAIPDVGKLQGIPGADWVLAVADDRHKKEYFQLFVQEMHDQGVDYPIFLIPHAIYAKLTRSTPRTVVIRTGVVRLLIEGVPERAPLEQYLK